MACAEPGPAVDDPSRIPCYGFRPQTPATDRKKLEKPESAPEPRLKRRFLISCLDVTSADRRRELLPPYSRFSRPPDSTALAPLRGGVYTSCRAGRKCGGGLCPRVCCRVPAGTSCGASDPRHWADGSRERPSGRNEERRRCPGRKCTRLPRLPSAAHGHDES